MGIGVFNSYLVGNETGVQERYNMLLYPCFVVLYFIKDSKFYYTEVSLSKQWLISPECHMA